MINPWLGKRIQCCSHLCLKFWRLIIIIWILFWLYEHKTLKKNTIIFGFVEPQNLQFMLATMLLKCVKTCKVAGAKTNTYKHLLIANILLQSNFVNTTLVHMTPSILWYIFARPNFLIENSMFYMTMTLDNATFRSPFCHVKDVVHVIIAFVYVMYI